MSASPFDVTLTAMPDRHPAVEVWTQENAERFLATYDSLYGQVRTEMLQRQLKDHLPRPEGSRVIDVGGGAGHQAVRLARDGYEVTVLEPMQFMISRGRELLDRESLQVQARVTFTNGSAFDLPTLFQDTWFDVVLCHGVLYLLPETTAVLNHLCEVTAPKGIVSIMTYNSRRMALDPEWVSQEVNWLGVRSRGDEPESLSAALATRGVVVENWYGLRLLMDVWSREVPHVEPWDSLLAAELDLTRRHPYRELSRSFHMVGRRR